MQIGRKKLRSSIVMCAATVLLLSGATYAWFTVGNTARVESMMLTVASEGNLYIADTEAGLSLHNSEMDIGTGMGKTLYPCTTADGKNMLKPVYATNDRVSGTSPISDAEKDVYYYETDIWLEVEETLGEGMSANTYDITLGKREDSDGGSYVNASDTSTHPEYCIRISFELQDGTVAVYEPNCNASLNGTAGTDYAYSDVSGLSSAFSIVHTQTTAGVFIGESGKVYYEDDSGPLFSVKGNTPMKVKVRIWFEGTDHDCMNQIQTQSLIGQIKFVSHKQEN